LQAENARVRDGSIKSDHPGFTGTGFVDYNNSAGSAVEWLVTPRVATNTNVVVRFANGSSASRPMLVAVNGSVVTSVVFPVTNGWSDWRTLAVAVRLPAGNNTITLVASTQDGGPNVDRITLDTFPT